MAQPTITAVTVTIDDRSIVTGTCNQDISEAGDATARFTIAADGIPIVIAGVIASGGSPVFTLQLNSEVNPSQVVQLSYAESGNGNKLHQSGVPGNELTAFTSVTVTVPSLFAATDLFTQLEALIWDTLEADTDWAAVFPPGNRRKRTGDARSPRKPGRLSKDMPEIEVVAAAYDELGGTSTSLHAAQTFDIAIVSGDMRPKAAMFPGKYQTLKALRSLVNSAIPSAYRPWLTRISFVATDDDELVGEKSPSGMSTLISLECEMHIAETELV